MTSVSRAEPPAVEQAVLAICRDVLGRSDVDVLDDLVLLAGSSVVAVEVVARTRRELGADVSVQDFFECPTAAALTAAVPADRDPAIPAAPPEDGEPVLSVDQERLWLEDQLGAGAVYNLHGRERLLGRLDVAALEASVRTILSRHETLRTRFPAVAGRPVPVVDALDATWSLTVVDRTGAGLETAIRVADEQAAEPFDLARGPLFRCLLVRLGAAEHVLSVTAHHIVCDAWSVGLFVRELAALYGAGGDAAAAALPALSVRYRDHAARQRRFLTGEELDRQVGYWREHLAGAPPALALPNSHRLVPAKGTADRVDRVLFDDPAPLRELCRTHDVTPFMVLLACLATLLGRWSGQRDVVVGVPMADRSEPGTEHLIGFFVNTLPFRVDLSGDPTFGELLARVRRAAYGGYAHAKAPFDALVKDLPLPRDPLRTPLFQVILNMGDDNSVDRLGDLVAEHLDQPVPPPPVDLAVIAQTTRDGALTVCLDFDSGRYDRATMTALAEQLGTLVRAATTAPGDRALPHPPAPDEPGAPSTPAYRPAPHLAVEHVAGADPDRDAVVDARGRWSYGQLDRMARRAADLVATAGGTGAGRIGVVRRPGAAFVATVLGCLRRGTAFTVVEPGGRDAARMLGITTLLDTDPDGDAPAGTVDVGAPLREPYATGGTAGTGRERAASPPADWTTERFGLDRTDRVTVLSRSPEQLTTALNAAFHAGGTLVLPGRGPGEDVGAVAGWLREHAVTVLITTPPVLRGVTADPERSFGTLRYAFVESRGELLSHDVDALRRAAPTCRCVGTYRTRQDGTPFAAYAVPGDRRAATAPPRVPLGTEVDTRARLLHASGTPAAALEVAELHAGTVRTGDLARRRPDGTLQLVGTTGGVADTVETVAALRDVPEVRDALVTEHVTADGVVTTTGYVAAPASGLDATTVRTRLASRLPDDLLPDRIVVLDTLPLTPGGDYDLSALPDPVADGTLNGYVAPRTPMERRLTDILEELLGLEHIGVHDGFFDMGGFSLLATQLTSRIRELFDVDLSLRDVFESPTVDGLATRILTVQGGRSDAAAMAALLDEIDAMPGA